MVKTYPLFCLPLSTTQLEKPALNALHSKHLFLHKIPAPLVPAIASARDEKRFFEKGKQGHLLILFVKY